MAEPHVDSGWLTALVVALLGSTGFWGWWTERSKAKAQAKAAEATGEADIVRATGEGAAKLVEGAVELNEDYRQQLKFVRGECKELRGLVTGLTARVEECDARHEDCERSLATEKEQRAQDIAALRAEIERLMQANPPAGY